MSYIRTSTRVGTRYSLLYVYHNVNGWVDMMVPPRRKMDWGIRVTLSELKYMARQVLSQHFSPKQIRELADEVETQRRNHASLQRR